MYVLAVVALVLLLALAGGKKSRGERAAKKGDPHPEKKKNCKADTQQKNKEGKRIKSS